MGNSYQEGQYAGRIVRHELGVNAKGRPQLVIVAEVVGQYPNGNPEAAMDLDYDEITPFRRTIWWTITPDRTEKDASGKNMLVRGSWGWILETLRYLGWTGTDIEQLDHDDPSGFRFDEHRLVVLECQTSTYEGASRDKWNIVRPGRAVAGSAKPANRKKFFADLRKKFKCDTQPSGETPSPRQAVGVGASAGADADAVPF